MATISSPLRSLTRSRPYAVLSAAAAGPSVAAGPSRIAALAAARPYSTPSSTSARSLSASAKTLRVHFIATRRWNSSAASSRLPGTEEVSDENLRLEAPGPESKPQQLGQIVPRLSLTFTCTANDCGHRSTHEFSKQAYTKGIVLVQCPECKNRHLIADHLGWFKESTEEGNLKNIEDLMRAKGETVRTGRVNWDGDIEYDGETKA